MLRSLLLETAARALLPLILVFSVFLLVRGHNEPGGGFVGGLVAASAFALVAVARGVEAARRMLRVDPRTLMALGLGVALASAAAPLFLGRPFFTGLWPEFVLPVVGKLGSPLSFDVGVYLVVIGVVLTVLWALMEE
jgi:multicomponent Na+:H+ antiporter subunit B